MAILGTLVNTLAIIMGGLLGLVLPRLTEGIRTTVMQGISFSVSILGITMALKTDNFLVMVSSLVLGGVVGEMLQIEKGLQRLGNKLEQAVNAVGQIKPLRRIWEKSEGKVAVGFVNTTLIYCVGAMAILGAMDSGIRHNHDILYMKAMLDGFSAIIFASTLGIGVLFSSLPVFLYQGLIALSATGIAGLFDKAMLDEMITQVTAVGGILIIGIGINLLGVMKINIANLLPSVLFAALSVPFLAWVSSFFHG